MLEFTNDFKSVYIYDTMLTTVAKKIFGNIVNRAGFIYYNKYYSEGSNLTKKHEQELEGYLKLAKDLTTYGKELYIDSLTIFIEFTTGKVVRFRSGEGITIYNLEN